MNLDEIMRVVMGIRQDLGTQQAVAAAVAGAKNKKKKKAAKKKKKRRGSSSSSRSTSRSSSDSTGSSKSSDRKRKYLCWDPKSKSRDVTAQQVVSLDSVKFKKKGDLQVFAAKHPGALSAYFLAAVRMKMMKGVVTRSGQLRDINVSTWAGTHSGLTELRDLREVQTLAAAMDAINSRELSRAMDILACRIGAIQKAKEKGSSWEKAERIELIAGGSSSSLGPSGLGGLAG